MKAYQSNVSCMSHKESMYDTTDHKEFSPRDLTECARPSRSTRVLASREKAPRNAGYEDQEGFWCVLTSCKGSARVESRSTRSLARIHNSDHAQMPAHSVTRKYEGSCNSDAHLRKRVNHSYFRGSDERE